MYFTENRYDRSIEWMMKGVPNFYPRGSGIVVTGRFEYTADMESLIPHWKKKALAAPAEKEYGLTAPFDLSLPTKSIKVI